MKKEKMKTNSESQKTETVFKKSQILIPPPKMVSPNPIEIPLSLEIAQDLLAAIKQTHSLFLLDTLKRFIEGHKVMKQFLEEAKEEEDIEHEKILEWANAKKRERKLKNKAQ